MATPQLSPGVLIREVDLTVGRADNVLDNIGAIVGPFAVGPVDEPVDIATENQLINTFGKPISSDAQYEYWMTASSFLSYGGALKVVRTDGTTLNNSNAAVGSASTTVKIKNYDDYNQNYSADSVTWAYASKNPGTWANNLKVCIIDSKADQILGINTTDPAASGAVIGYGVTVALSAVTIPGTTGSTSSFTGYLKGIITGIRTDSTGGSSSIDVKVFSRVDSSGGETKIVSQELIALVEKPKLIISKEQDTLLSKLQIASSSSQTQVTLLDPHQQLQFLTGMINKLLVL